MNNNHNDNNGLESLAVCTETRFVEQQCLFSFNAVGLEM